MYIDCTRQEVAAYYIAELNAWLADPARSRTIYLTDDAGLGTYLDIPPDDHLADLFTINDWEFGPRQSSQPFAPLTAEEITSLTQNLVLTKSVEVALNPFSGVREELFYPEDMAPV